MSKKRVVILGGGVSGLTVAYRLRDHAEVTVLEKADRIGGKLRTERIDGFTLEHGPDVFLTRKPWAMELCRELGIEIQPTNPDVSGSFIRWQGRLHPLPEGFGGLVPGRWAPVLRTSLLSPMGKLRLLLEPVVPRRQGPADESLGEFVRRRLGREAAERLVGPLLSGIFGGDIDTLSLSATFPGFRQLEVDHGSLVRGARLTRSGAPAGPVFGTLKEGMGALPEALASAGGARILTGQHVTGVEAARDGWLVLRQDAAPLECDVVVSAVPAFESARMLRSTRQELAAVLDEIPYNSSILVSLGWRQAFSLNGYGYLVPRTEIGRARACTWSSSKIRGRAPADGTLVRVFFGRGPADPALAASDTELLEYARFEVKTSMGISASPDLARITRWPESQPAYTMGHPDRLARIDALLNGCPGLYLTGAAYRGVGIPDCVRQANLTAERILHAA